MKTTYRWVTLAKHCAISGETPDEVHARRREHLWTDGVHCRVAPDGGLYVNPEEYNRWVEGLPPTPSSCQSAAPFDSVTALLLHVRSLPECAQREHVEMIRLLESAAEREAQGMAGPPPTSRSEN